MVGGGVVLMFIGFMLVMPRGTVGGSAPGRNVRLAPGSLSRTAGYQAAPGGRYRVIRLVLGFLLLIGGLVLILAGS